MASNSSIEWTQATWNPVTGCTKISAGCLNCYAERMTKRLKAMGQPNYRHGFRVTCHKGTLNLPMKLRKLDRIFVNSISDLFHEDVPDSFIKQVFGIIAKTPHHIYQVLTKRADRLARLAPELHWSDNLWMGVTVENAECVGRIADLRTVPARVRFLSMEPLIGPVQALDLTDIHWVIVGGESGPGARPMQPEWVRPIRDKCISVGVPFFFKQWGGVNKKKAGRLLDAKTWDQMPVALATHNRRARRHQVGPHAEP